MELLHDLARFTVAVVSHWQAYVTGGAVTGIVTLIERLTAWRLPKWAFAALFVGVFLLASFFLTWRDEYNLANALQASLNQHPVQPQFQVNIPPINVPPAQVIVNPRTKERNIVTSRASRTFDVEAPEGENFTVKHGAGCKPYYVAWEMTSGGNFWLQKPISYDETNIYFVASGKGITARVLVWCP